MKTWMNHKENVSKSMAILLGLSLLAGTPVMAATPEEMELEEVVFTSELEESAIESKKNTEQDEVTEEKNEQIEQESEEEQDDKFTSTYTGPVLTAYAGTVMGPSGKETYYNLDMSGVVSIMRSMGNNDEYWVREDGVKMLGDYIMCAANLDVHPRGSLVESSLGMCIVCDTGGFAYENPYQLDIAVTW